MEICSESECSDDDIDSDTDFNKSLQRRYETHCINTGKGVCIHSLPK